MAGNRASRELDRHDRGGSLQERNHHDAQDMQVGALVVRSLLHAGGQRPHQSVAQQDAQKCADQGGGDFVADLFRRTAERAHGDNHAEYSGDNSQAGQGIGHAAQGGDRQAGSVVMDLHVEIQELVQIKGFHSADGHAHGVAEVVPNVVIFEKERDTWRGSGSLLGPRRHLPTPSNLPGVPC